MTRHNVQILPAHQYYYYDSNNELQIGEYSADYLREIKIKAVNDWRDAMTLYPVEYAGYLFDFDSQSQQRVSIVALSGVDSPTGTWTTADNIDVPTDVDPSTSIQHVGIGWDSADANVQIMFNDGTGSSSKIDLGSSWPVPVTDR